MTPSDFIGHTGKRDVGPAQFALNPKTAEIINVEFDGFEDGEFVRFRKTSDDAKAQELSAIWEDLEYYPEDFDELSELAEISDIRAIENFALKHGPLFGSTFNDHGILREPIDMWYEAASYMDLGIRLQAASENEKHPPEKGEWRRLHGNQVCFEVEYSMLDRMQEKSALQNGFFVTHDNQLITYSAKTIPSRISPGYRDFILDKTAEGLWSWNEEKRDGSVIVSKRFVVGYRPEMGMDNKTLQDWIETRYDEKHPALEVGVVFNSLKERNRPFDPGCRPLRISLTEDKLADEMGPKLCRLMSEALVSLHCRNMHYGWQKHEFKPIFCEHIRYLWHMFAIYKDHALLGFCAHDGRPFMKTRPNQKYCSERCKKNAHR